MSIWFAVVLNWNGGDDTARCVASLAGFDGVVVADNGSTDGSLEQLRGRADVLVIENGRNLGFAGGNNAGVRAALDHGADWVVLINNDATLEPGALSALMGAAARHPGSGLLAGKLLFPDGRVQWAGQRVGLLTGYSGRPRGFGRPDGPAYCREQPVERAVGALMAVSRPAVEAAGLLDEELFAYVEDVDWSVRIRAYGFEAWFVPGCRAHHDLSASTGGFGKSTHPLYYGTRNTIVVVERHRPLGRACSALRRAAVVGAFGLHAALVLRRREAMRAVLRGFEDARKGRLGLRPG